MGAQGIRIGGITIHLDKDPGHSVAASGLAVDVVDRKLKKAVAVTAVVKVEMVPSAGNVAKPAKRGDKSKQMKKVATGCIVQSAASAAIMEGGGNVKINGAAGDNKQAAAALRGEDLTNTWVRRYLSPEQTSKKKLQEFAVVAARGRRRTVAPQTRKTAVAQGVAVASANMWALLSDEGTGHSETTYVDEVEEAPPADNVDRSNVGVCSGPSGGAKSGKQGKKTKTKKTKKGKKTPAALPCELEEEMTGMVATGSSRCREMVTCVCRAAVAVAVLGLYCRFSFC
ncbi:unnamed protein product [Alopecurus aequalis]